MNYTNQMFFPEEEPQIISSDPDKLIYVYNNGALDEKPIEVKISRKRDSFRQIKKQFEYQHLRLFNSEGTEYFEDDLEFVKSKAALYASNGEDFDPSSCFGEFQMTKKLGEGGFGEVWLAVHRQTGQKYAIKIIKADKTGNASDIDSIFVEAQTLKSLKHENIVKVENCLTLKNMKVVIIMEYLEGGELLQFVQNLKRLTEQMTRIFIKQIVKAMTYCHSNGLIHRDLKLENLLLVNREALHIKVIDFGIAGAMKTMSWQDLDIGSLAYMAPQCFINNKDYKVDGRIDVWAVGVIMFAMLTGQLPFKGNTRHEAIENIKKGKYSIKPQIKQQLSEQCLSVLKQCLNLESNKRITMEDLHQHTWISGELFQAHLGQEYSESLSGEQEKVLQVEKSQKTPCKQKKDKRT